MTVPDVDGSPNRAPKRFRVRLGTRLFLSLTLFLAGVMALVVALVEQRLGRLLRQAPTLGADAITGQIAETRALLLFVFAGAVAAGAVASYLMARRITGPYNEMVAQIQANQRAVADMNQSLEEKVRERTEDLSRMNDELRTAYAELTQIESQVIAAEKMASIGQLVAGICHEINTPNSAISAAVVNIAEYLNVLSRQVRMLLDDGVPVSLEDRFFGLVENALRSDPGKRRSGTADVRQHARLLEAKLTRYGVRNARELAVTFARLGFEEPLVEFIEASREEASVSSMLCLGFLENVGHLAVAVQDVRLSTDAISRMVKALKSYARTEKARKGYSHLDQSDMAEADVHDGLETALTLMRNQIKYGVVVERRYGKLPPIICSTDELNQVWTNIIHNAVQAMQGMGKILIETYRREHGITVRITDTGPGIARENLTRIFDPFFTTKGQGVGSGLGLSISQQIVERHDGEIRVDSQPGRTSFEVLLPFQPTLVAKHA